jgi:LysR family transcriptional regulator (chromosome initiation inhibitor)
MKANYLCFITLRISNLLLDYTSLFALATVVREGSFERAARTLHVTPSAVSQRIRLLEERVGSALVVRGQPCRATEAGRRLCLHVDRVRLLEHELHSELPTLEPEGAARVTLAIAVNADSLATWFAPAVAAFAASSHVLMDVAVDDQDHTAEWLKSGAVLAAVTANARPATGCNSRALGAMRYLAVATLPLWGCISRMVLGLQACHSHPAWFSIPKTSCRRGGCGGCAIGMWNYPGTRCRLRRRSLPPRWRAWDGGCIRRT